MDNPSEIKEAYVDLLKSYTNFKPVLSSLKVRYGNEYPFGILNEIRALSDHIARCYREGIDDYAVLSELHRADGHIKRLIFDTFKQLNIIFYDNVNAYEEKYFDYHWISLNDGAFWCEYNSGRKKVTEHIKNAKLSESIDVMSSFNEYQNAYIEEENIYDLLDKNKSFLERRWYHKPLSVIRANLRWLVSTIVLAVVPALIWEIYQHWHSIVNWINSIIHQTN